MRFPDRPLVTAGLGVAFALLILVALSSPALFQTVMSPSSYAPAALNTSQQVASITEMTTAATIAHGAPNGSASTATNSGTTVVSSSFAVPNSVATATSKSLTTSSTSTSFGAMTTVVTAAGTTTSATSATAPATTATMEVSTVIQAATAQTSSVPASAGPNSQGLFPSAAFSPSGSSLYVSAYRLGIIGAVALVIALVAAFTVYRKINTAE